MAPKRFDRFMVAVELASNSKVARLDDREFRCLLQGVWPLAAKSRPRGFLAVASQPATAADVANQARCPRRVAERTLEKMRSLNMLERDEATGLEHVHDWEEINPDPKADRTAADRQRRFRERHNGDSNGVTSNEKTLRNGGEVKKGKEGAKAPSSSGADRADRERAKATEDDRHLCRLLAELIRASNPKAKVRSDAAWLRDMRLLRERDANPSRDIERLIRWTFTDKHRDAVFWASTIQSPAGLREHFAQIWAKMQAATSPGAATGQVESSESFLARRSAG